MRGPRLAALAALLSVLAIAASACGGGVDPNGPDPGDALTLNFPKMMAGLNVAVDSKATTTLKKNAGKDSYVKDGSVFTLREGKELRAVLQVIRLTHDAEPQDPKFRKNLACQAIGSCRAPEKYNGVLFYKGLENLQKIFVWFPCTNEPASSSNCIGKFMATLIVRGDDVDAIDLTGLLQQALVVKPVRAA